MGNLVLHVDGSRVLSEDRNNQSFGWAAIALHEDQQIERTGKIIHGKMSPLSGCHENIAFMNGVLLAHDLGVTWKDVSIFCDDMLFGSAPSDLSPQNYRQANAERIHQMLDTVVKQAFGGDKYVKELTLQALNEARIVKVKGHQKHVYQERVDYLARFQARQGARVLAAEDNPLPMEDWLKTGLLCYSDVDGQRVQQTWHAPFINTLLGVPVSEPRLAIAKPKI